MLSNNLVAPLTESWASRSEEIMRFYQWLTVELAPTIQGNKPSTVLSLVNTCGQALLTMWRRHGTQFFQQTRVCFMTLHQSGRRETVLFYRPDLLERCLKQQREQAFFKSLGYPVDEGIGACLDLLRRRFQYACPHEIGLILGIPLKDVLGFMGLSDLPLTCRKEWCIYGNPAESLLVMQRFAQDRSIVLDHLARGMTCHEIMCGKLEGRSRGTMARTQFAAG